LKVSLVFLIVGGVRGKEWGGETQLNPLQGRGEKEFGTSTREKWKSQNNNHGLLGKKKDQKRVLDGEGCHAIHTNKMRSTLKVTSVGEEGGAPSSTGNGSKT